MAKSTKKPAAPKGRSNTSRPQQAGINNEVKYLGIAAGGLLLAVGVFIPNLMGPFGRLIHGLLTGLLGLGGYALPVALIAIAAISLTSRKIQLPVLPCVLLPLLFLSFLHIVNVVASGAPDYYSFSQHLGWAYSYGSPIGGGVVGAILSETLRRLLGAVGTIIVILAGIIILLVYLTGRSFVDFLGRGVEKARDYYEERAAYAEEDDEQPQQVKQPREITEQRVSSLKELPPRYKDIIEEYSDKMDKIDLIVIGDKPIENAPKILLIQEELEASQQEEEEDAAIPMFMQTRKKRPVAATTSSKHEPMVIPPNPIAAAPVIKGLDDVEQEEDFEKYDDTNDIDYDELANAASWPVSSEPVEIKINADGLRAGDGDDFYNDEDFDEYDDTPAGPATGAAAPRFAPMPDYGDYKLPPISFLTRNERTQITNETRAQVHKNSQILEDTLRNFRIEAKVLEVSIGPTVTRYDIAPGPGVKVSSIANLSNDLALSLAAQGIRIEAPIPGKSAVGIEIPNKEPQAVFLREILEDEKFETFQSKLSFAVGKDIAGAPVVTDIARMPHLLIAGATGSGKSVCINTLIASLLYKSRPDEVKLLMIDPKVVELSVYNGIPHLLIPVVTDPKKASGALNWAVQEMENRYAAFAETGCRDLKGYNRNRIEQDEQRLPQIVIIIDELADLMMACKGEVEEAICRLAQKARAAGIHLIVATQRPSVDVITGLIKANIPSRLAFAVSSGVDSRTVLDVYGAEKLLGKGDMLFLPMGQNKPIRVQGCFISDKEVENLVTFLKAQAPTEHTTEMIQQITMPGKAKVEGDVDEFFHDAVDFLLVKGKASTSMLQRQFRIGYNRASRLMDDLELRGIVGPEDGVKPRKVTITREEYREIYGDN
ncbi:MAG: DNA translocase FtsK [Defluviitaleaceae bacterium]|nr:DNA translocase FtsK [Defluviitaleaceae bacterium]